jgi:hypothetical protein
VLAPLSAPAFVSFFEERMQELKNMENIIHKQ